MSLNNAERMEIYCYTNITVLGLDHLCHVLFPCHFNQLLKGNTVLNVGHEICLLNNLHQIQIKFLHMFYWGGF